jgi:arylsulfatase
MNSFLTRFKSVLFQSLIGAAFAGIADGFLTALASNAHFIPTFVSVFALTTFALTLCSIVLAFGAALLFTGCADQTDVPSRLLEALYPRERDTRFKNGVLLFSAFISMAVFVAVVAYAGKILVEGMATTIYATISTALVGLVTALMLLGLLNIIAARTVRPAHWSGGRISDFLISPAGVLLLMLVLCVPPAWLVHDKLTVIISVLPQKAAVLILLTVLVSLAVGIARKYRDVPARLKTIVFAGIPSVVAVTLIIAASGLGIDNDVRVAITSDATFAPRAFKYAKKTLDFDDDGFINLMGDGDCDPFNADIRAGAAEIANNRIDEDCDGEDLKFDPKKDDFSGKWDFPVSPELSSKRYNIILITIDAAAPDRMSLYGYKRPTTPNLKKIAEQSALFKKAYSAGPSTRLAIPEMMTSKYGPDVDRAVGFKVPLEIKQSNLTMAEILKRAGYKTIALTSTPYFSSWKGVLQGFDSIDSSAAAFDNKKNAFHSGEKLTEATVAMLNKESDNRTKPMFMWVHYYDTHSPYTQPPDEKKFGKKPEDIYDSEMLYTDRQIARVVEEMDKLYDPQETVLIISADHGEAFDNNHKVKRHGHDLHSTIVHIPLIIRAPFVKPGVFEGPVNSLDFLPTIVNLLGIKGVFSFSGTSLVPQLVDGKDDKDRTIFSLFYLPENVYHKKPPLIMAGARTISLNYFKDMETNTERMYKFSTDPYEENNIVDKEPGKARTLRRNMAKFLLWLDNIIAARKTPKTPPVKPPTKSLRGRKGQLGPTLDDLIQFGPPLDGKDLPGPRIDKKIPFGPAADKKVQYGPPLPKGFKNPARPLETDRKAPDNKR